MPQKFIDQTTIQPDGKPGDDAFTAFEICNDNFQDAEARLLALEAGGGETGGRLDNEIAARTAADTALGARIDAANDRITSVDNKATDAGTAAANAQATANAANQGASLAALRAGDTFTGATRINAIFRVQGQNGYGLLRFITDGINSTMIQSVSADESSFAPLSLRGTSVNLTGTDVVLNGNVVRLDTNQLYVVGPAIPIGQYQGYILQNMEARPGSNADKWAVQYYRSNGSTGASWSDFTWRLGRTVDATQQQFMEYQPNGDIFFQSGTGTGGNVRFSSTGVLSASGGVSGGGSDPRIKDTDSLHPIENATDALLGLTTSIGRYREGFGDGGLRDRAFVMADDAMRENTPEVILENIIDGKYAGWATEQLIAYLVAAHREGVERERQMQVMIDSLIDRIAVLEGGA